MYKQLIRYRNIFFVLFFLFLSQGAAGDAHGQPKGHGEARQQMLWAVKGEKNTLYLMGSLHLLRKDSYPLPRTIEEIYECCGIIAFETDLESAESPQYQDKMRKRGLYGAGQGLTRNISQETYSLLKEKIKAYNLQEDQLDQYRPWFLAQVLAGMEITKLGFDPEIGIDQYFFRRAKKDRKAMIFLETNEYQLNLLSTMGKRDQDLLLKGVLRELASMDSIATDMLHAWEQGDADRLSTIIEQSFAGQQNNYKRLFLKRNKRWVSRITHLLRQNEDILVIVGAGHLVGKKSVLDILRAMGYRVTRL